MHKKVVLKILLIFTIGILFFSNSCKNNFKLNSLTNKEKEYLKNKKTIIFTGQINYAPFEFIDKNNEYTGMMIDLVRWISTEYGFKVKFIPQQFQKAQLSVLKGEADVITSLFYSEKRDKFFDFTKTVFKVPSSIFTYINRYDIQSYQDLNNKKISMQKGDVAEEFLTSHNVKAKIIYVQDFYEAVDKIVSFESDAVIGDEQVVWYHVFNKNYVNKIKIVGKPLYIGQNCMAVKNGNIILLNILNKGINQAIKQGILDKLYAKWIGRTPEGKNYFLKYRNHIIITLLIIFFILILLFINNIYLRKKVKEKVNEIIEKNEKLETNEEKLRNLINSIPDIICFVDSNDNIVEANKSFLSLFKINNSNYKNHTITELTNLYINNSKNLNDFIKEFSIQSFYTDLENIKYEKNVISPFNTNTKIIRKELKLILENDKLCYFDLIKIPIINKKNQIISIISIGRDITEKKLAENELIKIQKLNSLKNLSSRFAHDFNNILTGVIANITLLQMKTKNKEFLSLLKEAELAAESAKNISLQLLTFTKEAKTIKQEIDPVDLIEKAAKLSLRGGKCKYNILIKSNDIYAIKADQNQLMQALNNILINADQSMPDGGNIDILIENKIIDKFNNIPIDKKLYLIIEIKDHGIGIDKEKLSKIFDPFFTTKKKGNGLGLYSVYNICKNHNGYVFVKSQINKGTSFYLLIPSTGKFIKTNNNNETINTKFNYSILLLDDDPIIHKAANKLFKHLGCYIENSYTDNEFIEKFNSKKFDIVILDLILPDSKGGIELIKEIKDKNPNIIAIVSSGYSNNPAISNYKEIGFNYFLKKPYTIYEVYEILNDIKNKKLI